MERTDITSLFREVMSGLLKFKLKAYSGESEVAFRVKMKMEWKNLISFLFSLFCNVVVCCMKK